MYCLISVAGEDVMLLISLLNGCHCVLQRQLPVRGSYNVFHDVWIKALVALIVLLVIYFCARRIITVLQRELMHTFLSIDGIAL